MQMRMQNQSLAPGMQRRNDSRTRAKKLGIGQQIGECVVNCLEQDARHGSAIELPQWVQFGGHREDHVEMLAAQQSGFLERQPAFDRHESALRTETMAARVPPHSFVMPVGTDLLVPAHLGGTAFQDPIGCNTYSSRQIAGQLQGINARLNDRRDDHDGLFLRCFMLPFYSREAGLSNV
jgi:hypothetical protein